MQYCRSRLPLGFIAVLVLKCCFFKRSVIAEKSNHGVNVPMETFQYGDYFFTFYSQASNWDEAFTICRATHSRLAIVHTRGRADFLTHAITEAAMKGHRSIVAFLYIDPHRSGQPLWCALAYRANYHHHNFQSLPTLTTQENATRTFWTGFEDVWIGGRFLKDAWVWVANGRRIPERRQSGFPPWVQTPTQRGKNCLALDRKHHDRPLFVELNCRLPRPFVCEKSVVQAIDNYPQLGFMSAWAGSQYVTYHARVTWDEALAFCRQTGTMLAVVQDLRTANFLMSLMRRSRPELESVWIGGQYLFDEWVWLWNTTPLASSAGDDGYPPWLYNTTRPGAGKSCLVLDHHACRQARTGHKLRSVCEEPVFVDAECSKKKSLICQTVPTVREPEEARGSYMGTLYVLFSRELPWSQAAADCLLRNMSLAVLDTPHKLRFIITMMSELRDEWDHAWIGGKWRDEQRAWVWVSTNRTIPFSMDAGTRVPWPGWHDEQYEGGMMFPPWCENKYAYEEGSDCLNLDRGDHSVPVFYGLDCRVPQGYVCQLEEDSDPFVPPPYLRTPHIVVQTKVNFYSAEQACKTNNMSLAVVNTMLEAKRVMAEIGPGDVVWVGAKRESGSWRWKRTGESIPDVAGPDGYPPWEKLTTHSGAQCLAITQGPRDWPLFIEKPCGDRLNYVCQTPLKSYPTPDLAITFADQIYIFYLKNVNWFDASEICANSGTSLAPVTNIHVAKFLLTATADNFQPLWISGRRLSSSWEWVLSGETIPPTPHNGYPPWTSDADPDSDQQLARSCLLFNMAQGPVFQPQHCDHNHTFVCVKDEEYSEKTDTNVYQKRVRIANLVFSVISKITTRKKSTAYCLSKGMKLAAISKKEVAMQVMRSVEGTSSFWVDAELAADGRWVHSNSRARLETDMELPGTNTDPNIDTKCLVVKNLGGSGDAAPLIKMLPARCDDHAKTVCQKMAEKEMEEKRKKNVVARRGRTWEEAQVICKHLGGHLAGSSSWTFVKDFIAELDEDFGNVWVGGRYKNGSWRWEPTEAALMPDMLPGPVELTRKEGMCLLVDRMQPATLRLRAAECNKSLSYICQEETDSCAPLNNSGALVWVPEKCSSGNMETGSVCRATCSNHNTELLGPERVVCTDGSWLAGRAHISLPICLVNKDIPGEIHGALEEVIMHQNEVGILFLVDEHKDLMRADAVKIKRFIQNIIGAYPLGNVRSAGLMTFSSTYRSIIEVTEHNTCYFFEELTMYEPAGTDERSFMNALIGAEKEVYDSKSRRKGIVMLITNGVDEGPVNRTLIAERMKSNGVTMLVFGVGAINRNQLEEIASVSRDHRLLLFTFKNYDEMQNVANVFKRSYRKVSTVDCH